MRGSSLVEHLAREDKHQRHAVLPLADLLDLPVHLANPLAVPWHRGDLVYVFPSSVEGKVAKVVVKPGLDQKARIEGKRAHTVTNGIRTAGLSDPAPLRDKGMFEVLAGKI